MIFSCIFSGTFAPRLDISLKKNPTTFKFAHDIPTCRGILGDGIRKKNIFQPEVIFFSNFQTSKYTICLEVCKLEKILPVGIFLRIPSHRIPRQVGRVQI